LSGFSGARKTTASPFRILDDLFLDVSNGTLLMYEGQRNLTAVLQLGDSRARAQGVLRE
jgi:hypothetical protein